MQIAVTRLRIAPGEFFNMLPRHFWVLARTLEADHGAGPHITDTERNEMKALLEAAQRGEF